MIRDRGPDFTAAFDAVLADAGVRTVLCNVRTPRMNAICERMIGTLRRELFDRLLIANERHLRRVLTDYLRHYNAARPHRALGQLAPAQPAPGRRRSTSPSTGSAEDKSSADSHTSTRSPRDSPQAAPRRSRSPPRSRIRAPQRPRA